MISDLEKIWKDQFNFNRNFWEVPKEETEKIRQTKEFILHLLSECDELLRTTTWKKHRVQKQLTNTEQVRNELTDIFKYWISLCQVWDLTPENIVDDYWRKSMVCRQRYSQEFAKTLDEPCVIVDIDGILADYFTGLLKWLADRYPVYKPMCDELIEDNKETYVNWVSGKTFHLSDYNWNLILHDFRVSRGKVDLPVYPFAKDFLQYCHRRNWVIVLLTSRPIDRYPNIYTDTLEWLNKNSLPFDFLWWSTNKREVIASREIPLNVVLTVDDDLKYVEEYVKLGIKSYWIPRFNYSVIRVDNLRTNFPEQFYPVNNLGELIQNEERSEL